jgi:hypothetical protein
MLVGPDTTRCRATDPKGTAMLVYVVERMYEEPDRSSSVLSVWSDLDRAHAWVERQRVANPDLAASIAIRVTELDEQAVSTSGDLRRAV